MAFQYQNVYKVRKHNQAADALSQQEEFTDSVEETIHTFVLSTIKHPIISAILIANRELPEMLQLHSQLQQNSLPATYSQKESIIFFRNKILVPNIDNLRVQILECYHSTLMGGHGGTRKTYIVIVEVLY